MKHALAYRVLIPLPVVAAVLSGCSLWQQPLQDSAASVSDASSSAVDFSLTYDGYGFGALQNDAEKTLYAAIDTAVNKLYSEQFTVTKPETADRARAVLELYKDDHPEVFWIDDTSLYSYTESGENMTLKLNFKLEGDALRTAKETLEQSAQTAVADAPQDASDYQLELYVHDYILGVCEYDNEAAALHKNETVRSNEQNAYGALVEGRAVCEGYARAFYLLCQRLGVNCWVLQGTAENVNHIWNCVELDGDWYHVDVTWDDRDGNGVSGSDSYYYFNLSDSVIQEDHLIAPPYEEYADPDALYNGFIPVCDSTAYYYFNLNAKTIDDLDSVELPSYLAEQAAWGASYCAFVVGENLDFDEVNQLMVETYAYRWIMQANEQNGYAPRLSDNCKLAAYETRRVITMILDYAD